MRKATSIPFQPLAAAQLAAALADRTRCPCCRSENLIFGPLDWDENGTQQVDCTDCGRAWELVMTYTRARPADECCGVCREVLRPGDDVVAASTGECAELRHLRCHWLLDEQRRQTDASSADELLPATFVRVWTCGAIVRTACRYHPHTGRITDIETLGDKVDGDLGKLDEEYILVGCQELRVAWDASGAYAAGPIQ